MKRPWEEAETNELLITTGETKEDGELARLAGSKMTEVSFMTGANKAGSEAEGSEMAGKEDKRSEAATVGSGSWCKVGIATDVATSGDGRKLVESSDEERRRSLVFLAELLGEELLDVNGVSEAVESLEDLRFLESWERDAADIFERIWRKSSQYRYCSGRTGRGGATNGKRTKDWKTDKLLGLEEVDKQRNMSANACENQLATLSERTGRAERVVPVCISRAVRKRTGTYDEMYGGTYDERTV